MTLRFRKIGDFPSPYPGQHKLLAYFLYFKFINSFLRIYNNKCSFLMYLITKINEIRIKTFILLS